MATIAGVTWQIRNDRAEPGDIRDLALGVHLLFEPRDLWVGVFWDRRNGDTFVYVCVIPCLPIRFRIQVERW
jgi:hypothetical protein